MKQTNRIEDKKIITNCNWENIEEFGLDEQYQISNSTKFAS